MSAIGSDATLDVLPRATRGGLDWEAFADRVLAGLTPRREEAMAVATAPDDELLPMLHAAFRVRRRYFARRVRVHVLQNARSGLCPEDCAFCSQSVRFDTTVPRYRLQSVDELVAAGERAVAMGAVTYCMVTSTRGPSDAELATICEAARRLRERHPVRICTSLGLLAEGQAEALASAGVGRYNHNLETSARFFPAVCSTHGWGERVATVRRAKAAGMETCCGGILGMGESREDWVELALALRDLEVDSVPVNFLDPRPGTPLGDRPRLSAQDCLRGLALFRFCNPTADVRVAGGRETSLGALQALALWPASSMFTNGYLTTPGADPSADARMITEAGFEAEVLAG
jgi:biotin synthase